ncbi:hypothetical protein [Halobellus rufus]|uniref:hypothetical protein n=1 Tax=Halobellus rufus TaxID=1448860 RepID=UPI0012E002C0|nr:hypothetical protein [Halobellus rufus]
MTQALITTDENEGLGSGFKSLMEKATPKTELYEQMQQDQGRSEEELEDEVTREMIERAEETENPEHKDTKLTGYISN